jgi:polysaccharide biosynthesis protein PslG
MPGAPQRILQAGYSLVVVCAIALLALFAGSARAAEIGTVPDMTWGISSSEQDQTVSLIQQAGIEWVRMNISWKSVEPSAKGQINSGYISEIDGAVNRARAAGLSVVMPMADNVPYWASADPNKYVDSSGTRHWNVYYRPTSFNDYADAFSYVVNHYKALGVHVYEIWNEPNHASFWPSGPNPAEYVQMLRATYPAIKAADPSSTVLGGALSQNDYRFLAGVYAAGGGNYFDAVSTHSYPAAGPDSCWNDSSGHRATDAFCSIEEIRNTMVANGDAGKQVWLDEFGWSTCSNSFADCYGVGVSEAQQASYITAAFQKLQSYPWVKAGFVYQFRNLYFGGDSPGEWGDNLGLLRTDFTPKPAYDALKAYATGGGTTGAGSATGGSGSGTGAPTSGAGEPSDGSAVQLVLKVARGGKAASGQAVGASTGQVVISLQRHTSRGWRTAARRNASVAGDGSFSVKLRRGVTRGRAVARYQGASGHPASPQVTRYFA